MATLKYGNGGIRYDLATAQVGAFASITANQVVITTNDGWKITGGGNFMLSGSTITGGTISTYSIYKPDGSLYTSMSGLLLGVSTYNYYASRGDGLGLYKAALSGGDTITGGDGNDTFLASSGSDTYNGGTGTDIVHYSTSRASNTVTKSATTSSVTVNKSGSSYDSLANVERLHFSDNKAIAFDVEGIAGQAYRMYQAAFDRKPDGGGLGYWVAEMDKGASLVDLAVGFMHSAEFKSLYGTAPSNAELVTRLYQNVLHRGPDSEGYQYWTGLLDSHKASVMDAMIGFSESVENKAAVVGSISGGMEYDLWLG